MERSSFVLLYKYYDVFKYLSLQQAGTLIKAIYEYQIEKTVPEISDLELNMAFKFIQKDIDFNNSRYQQKCLKNKKNGQKGGAPKNNSNALKIKEPISKNNPTVATQLNSYKTTHNDVGVDKDLKILELSSKEPSSKTSACEVNTTEFSSQTGANGVNFKGANSKEFSHFKILKPKSLAQEGATKELSSKQVGYKISQKVLETWEMFKSIYEKETRQPYAKKQAEFVVLNSLLKQYGSDIVKQKIEMLFIGCKNAVFWFTKNGFSDFTIGKLQAMWNNIVPIETQEQKQKRLSLENTLAAATRVFAKRQESP